MNDVQRMAFALTLYAALSSIFWIVVLLFGRRVWDDDLVHRAKVFLCGSGLTGTVAACLFSVTLL